MLTDESKGVSSHSADETPLDYIHTAMGRFINEHGTGYP